MDKKLKEQLDRMEAKIESTDHGVFIVFCVAVFIASMLLAFIIAKA